jgi:hypothetical protein
MKTNSSTRLAASEHWWEALTSDQKKLYIKQHPNSKYAKEHIGNDEEEPKEESKGEEETPKEQPEEKEETTEHETPHEEHEEEITQEHRSAVGNALRRLGPKIADRIKAKFDKIGVAGAALKRLASGHELEEEHKETLREMGGFALKTLGSHVSGSPEMGKVIARVGTVAVEHAIDKFAEHKRKNQSKGDIETFVDGIAEGLEQAEHKAAEKTFDAFKSVGSHIKKSANHIVDILNKSFHHIKPASEGLKNLATGKKLEPEQKKAMQGLGKIALATSIASLPGGLAVHLGAGIGATALTHAFKKMKEYRAEMHEHGGGGHGHHGILHHFVESLGEGLEDALLEHAAGEGGAEHGHE